MIIQKNIIPDRLPFTPPWPDKSTINRTLHNAAFLLVGVFIAAAFLWLGDLDYQHERRIEAEKITYCANNPGVSDCQDVPKTNRWRN